ncbi:MAG: hypothetical protein WC815_14860 [Vicinamibacterales bacterium]
MIGVVIALSLLTAVSTGVLAQQPTIPEYVAELTGAFGEGILAPTPVLDAPFSAEAETVWQPRVDSGKPKQRATARYYRDREGRVRVEQMFVGVASDQSPQRVIVLPDRQSLPVYLLDPAARTASKIPRGHALMTVGGANSLVMPFAMNRFIDFPLPQRLHWHSQVAIEQEPLGQRAMAGVQVAGTRFAATWPFGPAARVIQTTEERWASPELKLVVYDRVEDSEIGSVEYRLTRITRVEPTPALFEVPANYEVNDVIQPALWGNPYLPETWPAGRGPGRR